MAVSKEYIENTNPIILENNKRKRLLFPKYNPLTGQGSIEDRFEFKINSKKILYLPVELKTIKHIDDIIKKGSFALYKPPKKELTQEKLTITEWKTAYFKGIVELRYKYDFEFWAYNKIKIQQKEKGSMLPFLLRPAQRKLLHELEKLRKADKPIRIILLKARQWGGSTLTQFYFMWIQLYYKQNWNSVIVTEVLQQANNIKNMYEQAIALYPNQEYTMANAVGKSSDVKQINETGCKIYIGSLQNPNALRSGNYAMAHYSEVGAWKATTKLKPSDLISSVSASIISRPYTIIVMESTAKGEGTYFHKEWLKAKHKENNFVPVFVAWWEIETYRVEFDDDKQRLDFYNNLDDYGKFLWSLGATLEGIHWYYNYKKEVSFEKWQMNEEYPSTPEEAFISSGERVIPLQYVKKIEKTIQEPKFVGDIVADGKKGKEALINIRFEENTKKGCLKIWDYPDKTNTLSNRYVVSMDIGGVSDKADYTVIRVIDRYWRMEGGVDEFVATWRGHYDVDLAVWKAAQIAKIYSNALLVVESNTIDSKYQHNEGNHTYTVFDEIFPFYSNFYMRIDQQRIKEGLPQKYGFFTSQETKSTIITNLIASYRDEQIIERDIEMITECNEYEWKNGREMGAKDGCHDDVLMASAIGMYVSKNMEPPTKSNKKQYFLNGVE